MNLYPNLYALLESDSHARQLFERAPAQIRRQLLVRRQTIRSVAALDADHRSPAKLKYPKTTRSPTARQGVRCF